jgi:hypothetical protein
MNITRWLALLSLLAALTLAVRTEDGPFIDPNGRLSSSSDGGGAMDPNGRGFGIDPNG